jgi:hypothetical protein
VEAWAEDSDNHTVGKGTASVGNPKDVPYLQSLEFENAEPEELRILAGLKAGDELPSKEVTITQGTVDSALGTITDTLDWYKGDSPWGGAIAPPSVMQAALQLGPERTPEAVSFYGATELHNVNGPVKVGVPYRASGKLLCVGTGGRTEFYWYDSCLEDQDGKRIAEMRHMYRFMKASSPLYNPEAEDKEYDQR